MTNDQVAVEFWVQELLMIHIRYFGFFYFGFFLNLGIVMNFNSGWKSKDPVKQNQKNLDTTQTTFFLFMQVDKCAHLFLQVFINIINNIWEMTPLVNSFLLGQDFFQWIP